MARKTIAFTCQRCSAIFHGYNRGARRNIFCSRQCAIKAVHEIPRPSLNERFMGYVEKAITGCWLWTGHKDLKGYGVILVERRGLRAHRLAYEMFVGPIPTKHMVCHRCDEPSCVNPEHLFTGTNTDNMRDMVMKDRRSHTLTTEQVTAIRSDTRFYRIIAAEYCVSEQFICDIKKRRVWKYH